MAVAVYPQGPAEWRTAIEGGIGVTGPEGRDAFRAGDFPYEKLRRWIPEAFREGFSPDFVPALLRNIQGLVAWAYGGGGEPYWPGSDSEGRGPV